MKIENFSQLIAPFEKKSSYLGNEWNAIKKNWDKMKIKFALAYPENYEIGMSNLGIQILYHLINNLNYALCERVFLPRSDLMQHLEKNNIPLFSLESKTFLNNFTLLGFSLMYELTYTNFLKMLSLAKIPLLSSERNKTFPLICAGGSCTFNPEPIADFLDFVVLGEGEEVILEILDVLNNNLNLSKKIILQKLAKIEGVYVPQFYQPQYFANGNFKALNPLYDFVPSTIKKRYVKDLGNVFYPTKFIVPYIETIQERISLEIFRGCTQGCRYCQAGIIYRPLRERSVEKLIKLAEESYKNTGFEEIALLSLSTSDYSQLEQLCNELFVKFKDKGVLLSLPSLRPQSFTKNIHSLKNLKKGNLTLVAEAASERLRKIINKKLKNEDIFKAVEIATKNNFKTLKIYFMLGLPTETQEDINTLFEMVNQIIVLTQKTSIKQITISLSTFVPKPHTPFQWEKQESLENIYTKQNFLLNKLTHPKTKVNWVQPEKSLLEGIFSRGNRKLSKVLLQAIEKRLFFTATEEIDFEKWKNCFAEEKINYFSYLEAKDKNIPLSWEHLNCGVNKNFLWKEKLKAENAEQTLDCREKCIFCDIKKDILKCIN